MVGARAGRRWWGGLPCSKKLKGNRSTLTLNLCWVRIFSTSSTSGIRSFTPTCGMVSRLTKLRFRRTCLVVGFRMYCCDGFGLHDSPPDGLHLAQAHRVVVVADAYCGELVGYSA